MVRLDKQKAEYYSGAILNISFNENNDTDKYVLIADLKKGEEAVVKPVQLDCKKLVVFRSDNLMEIEMFCQVARNEYVKVIYESDERLDFETLKALRKRNPNLITFSVINNNAIQQRTMESKKDLSNSELFDKFVLERTGKPANPKVKELFLELMGENLYETD